MRIVITEEIRSMIATAVVAAGDPAIADDCALCCGVHPLDNCALIVGDELADALHRYAYDHIACGYIREGVAGEPQEEAYEEINFERISDLYALDTDEDPPWVLVGEVSAEDLQLMIQTNEPSVYVKTGPLTDDWKPVVDTGAVKPAWEATGTTETQDDVVG